MIKKKDLCGNFITSDTKGKMVSQEGIPGEKKLHKLLMFLKVSVKWTESNEGQCEDEPDSAGVTQPTRATGNPSGITKVVEGCHGNTDDDFWDFSLSV